MTAHAIFANNERNWAKTLARKEPCVVEVPEWGPEGKPFKLHLRPPRGIGLDAYNQYQFATDQFKWSMHFIMQTACDPLNGELIFLDQQEHFEKMENPQLVINIALQCITELNKAYPKDPEEIKNDSSQKEGES